MGRDKATLTVGGRTLLDRLLTPVPPTVPVVVVGPEPDEPARPVTVTREVPPGGGPLAGLAAGLGVVATPLLVVTAVDLPHAGAATSQLVARLRESDVEAVVPTVGGHLQPLLAAYRLAPLLAAVRSIGDPADKPVRAILHHLRVAVVPGDPIGFADVDTPADLARARTIMAANKEAPMEEWLAAVSTRLGVTGDVDVDLVLDVARDSAHQVERPAAPLTTYLLGVAVASGRDPVEAAALIRDLAASWDPARHPDDD